MDRGGRPEYGNEPRGGFRGGPRGGARGGFRGGRGGMMQYPHGPSRTPYIPAGPRNDGKLCITQIPADSCTVERVRAYFQKFGHILSVGVSPHTASALIEFATADEAQAALGSPEAPFGNRFVRTFWYNPAMDARKSQDTEFTSWKEGDAPQATRIELTPEERAHRQEEAARMRTALQTQMAELQRKQAEERQRIVANLEHLSEKERAEIMRSLSSVSHTIAATPQVLASTKKMTGGSGVMAAGQTPAVAGDEMNTDDAATAETPEALQARLAAVKAEHEALGLSAPGFCGRGRGRGRGAFRGGRGGGSMSLDLRPKKFAVHGFPADQAPAVAAHFQV